MTYDVRGPRRGVRRSLAVLATATVLSPLLPAGPATAAGKPSAAAAERELRKLNDQVDGLVDRYNKARTDLDAAKKRMQAVNSQLKSEQREYNRLHSRVAQIAAAAYKNGDVNAPSVVLAAKDPETALRQMSTFTQLSNSRGAELRAFLASLQRIQREKAQARSALEAVNAKTAVLKEQKAKVDRAIARQKALLRKAGQTGSTKSSGSSGSSGGSYTGPASGPARKALDYAYAQLGKPYIYGGTGPRGYDCSGLTMMAWRAAGVSLPRVVPDQYNATRRVAFADLQPGDLFFSKGLGHMGMYVGNGKMIHAPHTGTVVKIVSVTSGYYRNDFLSGGRP